MPQARSWAATASTSSRARLSRRIWRPVRSPRQEVEGMDGGRRIWLAQATGRTPTRAADEFVSFRARSPRVNRIVRFGAGRSRTSVVLAELGLVRPMAVTTRRGAVARSLPVAGFYDGVQPRSRRNGRIRRSRRARAGRRRSRRAGRRQRDRHREGGGTSCCPSASCDRRADDVRRRRVDALLQDAARSRSEGRRRRTRRAEAVAAIYDPELTVSPGPGDGRDGDERARALRRGLLRLRSH